MISNSNAHLNPSHQSMPHLLPRSFHSGPLLLTVAFVCIFATTTCAALNDVENADSEAVATEAAEAAQTRFARASPLRWGKRGSEVLRWGKREPLRWGKRSTDGLVGPRTVRDAPLRWGKRSTGLDMLMVDENEPHYVRFQREASPLRWGKRFYDEDKRAPLRWGKRAPSRFGKRAPTRFGKRDSLDDYLEAIESDYE
ncbi:hypothetical protein TCAL_10997 [Tigriopus californicus]|uniref:Uncharacterized protein n=2 Tax=Tigriopus californicus TaxID=6832 RepID=A0A553NBG3_TIGCA|nr:hypothetical protein TCAL_10997 [Tigriopus californicus]